MVSAVLRVVVVTETLMVQLVLIELSATNARTEPAGLAYILTNFRPSSGMMGMVMICKNARQAPRAASQEARMCDLHNPAYSGLLGEKTLIKRRRLRIW